MIPVVLIMDILHADCPGTSSENAGSAAACAGCPNQAACASAPKGADPGEPSYQYPTGYILPSSMADPVLLLSTDLDAISERMKGIKHKVRASL